MQIMGHAMSKDAKQQLFYPLAKEVFSKSCTDVSLQEEFKQVHAQFLITYLPAVMKENPEEVSSFLLHGDKERLLLFLDRFSGISCDVPTKIFQEVLQAIADVSAEPKTPKQKTALYRCFAHILATGSPEALLTYAKIYHSINPKDSNWVEIYRKLFSRALEHEDHQLLTWLGSHADNEKRKRSFAMVLLQFPSKQDPHSMVSTIEIMELFHRSTDLNIKPILLQLITSALQKKSSEIDLSTTLQNIKKILGSSHFVLNETESKTLSEKLCEFSASISFDSFMEIFDSFMEIFDRFMEIMELFHGSIDLNIKPILLQLITSELQKKSSEIDLSTTLQNIKKILGSSHFCAK
jgi:uncharacterized protein (DUF1330 family)